MQTYNKQIFFCLLIVDILICIIFVMNERSFPYWDLAFYEEQTISGAHAFSASMYHGVSFIVRSLSDDYNFLFTLPLIPFVSIFGPIRIVFVLAVFLMYFVPYVVLSGLLARRIFSENADPVWRVAGICALFTVNCWSCILLGYPDIGGAAMIVGILLLYDGSEGGLRLRPIIGVGLLGALAVLFRRHYVYPVFAVYSAFAIDVLWRSYVLKRSGNPTALGKRMLYLAFMGAISAVSLYLVAPGFFLRALSSTYRESMSAWQHSSFDTLKSMIGTVGLLPLLLAICGLMLLPRLTTAGRATARVLLTATTIWVILWVVSVRQQPYHYPHILPLAVIIGLVSLYLYFSKCTNIRMASCGSAVVSLVLLLNLFVAVQIVTPAPVVAKYLPRFAAADPIKPIVNPAYDEIVRLVGYVHSQVQNQDKVIVAASSHIMNFDMLRVAERSMYGANGAKIRFLAAPQVDSLKVSPLPDFMAAQYVVVAKPFQSHLRPEDQKVVRVLLEAFEQHWPIAEDFTLMSERFTLGTPDTEVKIYKRVRMSSPDVMADTRKRMNDYMNEGASSVKSGVHS
jgi:hypothetical protein